jgi:glycosyltransferase involved in cell wall biosynthesis
MRVLFVSSGNGSSGISPIIKNQGESLQKVGVELDYFAIRGKGVGGYLRGISELRRELKGKSYDIVHAHYWLSGIVASLAGAKPLIVSLMGDDVKATPIFRWIIYIFHYLSWQKIIVKSRDMYETLGIREAHTIPNGVDMERFKPIERGLALQEVGWDGEKRHILFTSDPMRVEKNFKLAEMAFSELPDKDLELHYLKDIPHAKIPYYYNASSVVILTSLWEGSPNAIKEAMACNVPIVSTDVGDVRELISETEGCYISSFNYREFASDIAQALKFEGRTDGRERIQHLNREFIADKILNLYKGMECVE